MTGDPDGGGRVGAIRPEVAAEMEWKVMESKAGSLLIFNHWFPHRSPPNYSTGMRRTAYLIYNPATQGDRHAEYVTFMADIRARYRALQEQRRAEYVKEEQMLQQKEAAQQVKT